MGATTRSWTLALVLLIGCARAMKPEVPTQAPEAVLEMARARPIPDPVQARYGIKVRSELLGLAGSTNGVLIVERPRAHLAILGPLGGPIFTLSTDGTGVSIVLPREERHLVAVDAAQVLDELGAGLVGLDDFVGLLVGDIPFDEARLVSTTPLDGDRVRVVMRGPQETLVSVVVRTADATPETLAVHDASGEALLGAVYSPFEPVDGGALAPTAVALEVPALELRVELTYRSWRELEEVPDVFGLGAPPGFRTESLEQAIQELAAGIISAAAE